MPDTSTVKEFLHKNGHAPDDAPRFKILKDGRWLHDGGEIKRPAMVKLFSTILKCDENGQHWLEIPQEKHKVEVEDSAYISRDIRITGLGEAQDVVLTSNLDENYIISRDMPLVIDEAIPYVLLNKGLKLRISRPHFYELAKYAFKKEGRFYIQSNGDYFLLEDAHKGADNDAQS